MRKGKQIEMSKGSLFGLRVEHPRAKFCGGYDLQYLTNASLSTF